MPMTYHSVQIYVISEQCTQNVSKNPRHTGKLSNKDLLQCFHRQVHTLLELPRPFGNGGTELRRGTILYEAEKATSFFSLQPLRGALGKLEPLSLG